ncbi:MAG: carbamoyl-phosphate synthase domain-containing protein, partial [Alphaproteobacteria bacterium]|nr:carbamoyl-phosphate synthase domain-containing protein [Alphaproteobacteria bacterium]
MPETNTTAHRVGPPTAVLVLGDGRVVSGQGLGASASAVGEVCFNTSMTGYQEIISDPSYAGQLITFTFPHIGNVGSNEEDLETITPAARGCILRCDITEPSNWRASRHLDAWLVNHGLPGIAGVDTRALTQIVRKSGAPNGIIAHNPDGRFDLETLRQHAATWPGLEGMDLAREVSCSQSYTWDQTAWSLEGSFGRFKGCGPHVVAIDFGAKHNILRCLASAGCRVTVVPA